MDIKLSEIKFIKCPFTGVYDTAEHIFELRRIEFEKELSKTTDIKIQKRIFEVEENTTAQCYSEHFEIYEDLLKNTKQITKSIKI